MAVPALGRLFQSFLITASFHGTEQGVVRVDVLVEESSHDHRSFASDDILFHFSSKNINLCFSNATKITIQTCL